jgi:hypothetical protein
VFCGWWLLKPAGGSIECRAWDVLVIFTTNSVAKVAGQHFRKASWFPVQFFRRQVSLSELAIV